MLTSKLMPGRTAAYTSSVDASALGMWSGASVCPASRCGPADRRWTARRHCSRSTVCLPVFRPAHIASGFPLLAARSGVRSRPASRVPRRSAPSGRGARTASVGGHVHAVLARPRPWIARVSDPRDRSRSSSRVWMWSSLSRPAIFVEVRDLSQQKGAQRAHRLRKRRAGALNGRGKTADVRPPLRRDDAELRRQRVESRCRSPRNSIGARERRTHTLTARRP